MSSIVITGASGQLGRALARRLAAESPVLLATADLDIGRPADVDRKIDEIRPEVVFNAAAFNHVDDAEIRVDEAFRTNGLGPWALGRAAERHRALVVHFSTDYVFRGDATAPYAEGDPPSPQSVYAASKLAGEQLVERANPRHMVIRTAALYGRGGSGGKGTNFVETMLRLGTENRSIRVVDDQRTSPTFAEDLAAKVVELFRLWRATRDDALLGLYHVTNAGSATWYELACEIFRLTGRNVAVEPTSTEEFGARAQRPAFSVLARRHLERLGLDDLRPWQNALADYVVNR
jgi:dTDP-4-dehydrorhamnose reductase